MYKILDFVYYYSSKSTFYGIYGKIKDTKE